MDDSERKDSVTTYHDTSRRVLDSISRKDDDSATRAANMPDSSRLETPGNLTGCETRRFEKLPTRISCQTENNYTLPDAMKPPKSDESIRGNN